jgi:hypothetical protein
MEARWKRRREDTRRARGKRPYRATREKGGGSGRGGCSSHIDNEEQCGSDTSRQSVSYRARDPRFYYYETNNRRNGDRGWCGCRIHSSNSGKRGNERRSSNANETSESGFKEPTGDKTLEKNRSKLEKTASRPYGPEEGFQAWQY